MRNRDRVMAEHCDLTEVDRAWLDQLIDEWSLLADLAFADLILWVPGVDDNIFWACGQVRPTTGPTSLEDDVVGEDISYDPEHLVTEAYLSGEICHTSGNKLHAGIPVDVTAIPIMDDERCVAVVEMHTNQMGVRAPGALEDAYLEAAQVLIGMVHHHQFPLGGERRVPWVSPRVGDGMLRVNANGMISYASPNAMSAYRRLGLTSDLYGEDFVSVTKSLLKERGPVERPLAASLAGRGSAEVDLESSTANVRLRVLPLIHEDRPDGAAGAVPRHHRTAFPGTSAGHQGRHHPGDPPSGEEQPADRGGAAAPAGPANLLTGGEGCPQRRHEAGRGHRRGARDPQPGLRLHRLLR